MGGLITPFPKGRKPLTALLCISDGNIRGPSHVDCSFTYGEPVMNAIIYLVGLIVIIMAILSFVGMR